MKAAYQGIPGAYSFEALNKYFKNVSAISCERFEDVFLAVKNGCAEYGVIPIENSISGSVTKNIDLLGKNNLNVVGETTVKIEHILMGVPGAKIEDIESVYSHEQALLQCEEFLVKHPNWLRAPYFNTAVSARYVSEKNDKKFAAIASKCAMDMYKLRPIKENISINEFNVTRFFIIAKKTEWEKNANKASICFSLKHQKGSLALALSCLSSFNLTRIESRPTHVKNFEYRFYIDMEGDMALLKGAVLKLLELCKDFSLLGVYAKGV